jgi:short-subunit dehydrogenase
MKRILVVGGANGIGLSIATELAKKEETEKVYIVDKSPLMAVNRHDKMESYEFDLTGSNYSIFDNLQDIDGLMVTVGFGRLALFKDIPESMIAKYFNVNTIGIIRIIKHYYDKLLSNENFYCGVMVSIAGFMSSPFFSLYGATKAALKIFIESVNVEIDKAGSSNRILNVSPGSIQGTSFNGGKTNLNLISALAKEIIDHLESKKDLFIPKYNEVFHEVLERYHDNFRKEGGHSYDYKLNQLKSSWR